MTGNTKSSRTIQYRGYTCFNIQLPLTRTAMADYNRLMELTQVLRVEETSEIGLDEVDLWKGIQDAKNDNFARPECEFEF